MQERDSVYVNGFQNDQYIIETPVYCIAVCVITPPNKLWPRKQWP